MTSSLRIAARAALGSVLALSAAFACAKTTGTIPLSDDSGAAPKEGGLDGGLACVHIPPGGGCGTWPDAADTFDDASRTGCFPRPTAGVCEVPSGSIVNALDGGVIGPDGAPLEPDCCDRCDLDEYAIYCEGARPDPSLGCHGQTNPIVTPGPPGGPAGPWCCPSRRREGENVRVERAPPI